MRAGQLHCTHVGITCKPRTDTLTEKRAAAAERVGKSPYSQTSHAPSSIHMQLRLRKKRVGSVRSELTRRCWVS